MSWTFADAYHFLALLNPKDRAHERAVRTSEGIQGRLITTEFVLIEVGDAFSDPKDRPAFLTLLDMLVGDPNVEIEPAASSLLRAGIDLYRRRPDKDWSLTDCTSFIVMDRLGIREALTADRHFEQAGFVALLK